MHGAYCGPIQWQASNVNVSPTNQLAEGDQYTCVEFDGTGELLAVGDRGGRITVFKLNTENGSFDIYCAFTSHEPEFDYLKSLEIEEKINSITWLGKMTSAHHLLSANDKTVKLWRLSERHHEAYNFNTRDDEGAAMWFHPEDQPDDTYGPPVPQLHSSQLRVPQFRKSQHLIVEARPRRVFSNAHTYHINAVSLNSDQETFLSADDLRINLWNLDVSNQSFTIVDLKPSNMEDLSEVVTCARFHPSLCYLLAYSTSKGIVRLCDMRVRALCDNHVLVFEDPRLSQNFGFFADIIASLSDFRFSRSGQYILARDYLTLKVWDIRMGDRPCELYPVHEPFRCQLCMMYENDAIFDKFTCSWSEDDNFLITGSYGSLFRIFDRHGGSESLYSISSPQLDPISTSPTSLEGNVSSNSLSGGGIPLSPQRFVSPNDPIGSCLGLTTVCVAPSKLVDELLNEHSSISPDSHHSGRSTRSRNSHSGSSNRSASSTDEGGSVVRTIHDSHISTDFSTTAGGDSDSIAATADTVSCKIGSSVSQQQSATDSTPPAPIPGGDRRRQRKSSHKVRECSDSIATTLDPAHVEVNGYPLSVNGNSLSSSSIGDASEVTNASDTKRVGDIGDASSSAPASNYDVNPTNDPALAIDVLQLRRRIARMQTLHSTTNFDDEVQVTVTEPPQSGEEEVVGVNTADTDDGTLSLPGVRQLDCQRKLLHMTWHPHQLLAAAISGNQLYMINNSLSDRLSAGFRRLSSGPLPGANRFNFAPIKCPEGNRVQLDKQQICEQGQQGTKCDEVQDGEDEGESDDDDDDEDPGEAAATTPCNYNNGHDLPTVSWCGKLETDGLTQTDLTIQSPAPGSRSPLMKVGRKRRRRHVPNGDSSLVAEASGCSSPKKDAPASCSSNIPPLLFTEDKIENGSTPLETSMDCSIDCDKCDVTGEHVIATPPATLLCQPSTLAPPTGDHRSLSSITSIVTPYCTENTPI